MKKTYEGSCHCGAVRFAVDVELASGTSRCNCSICSKTRLWKVDATPAELTLHQGHDQLTDYRFNSCAVRHQFCKVCGVKLFGWVEVNGQSLVVVSVASLEATDVELAAASITYQDGRHDTFDRPPKETGYL